MSGRSPGGRILVVCDDLFFWSRIRAAAGARAAEITRIGSEPEMERAMQGGGVSRIVVDLGATSFDALAWAPRWKARPAPPELIGFFSHVDEKTAGRAREAGFDRVVARGRFARDPSAYLG